MVVLGVRRAPEADGYDVAVGPTLSIGAAVVKAWREGKDDPRNYNTDLRVFFLPGGMLPRAEEPKSLSERVEQGIRDALAQGRYDAAAQLVGALSTARELERKHDLSWPSPGYVAVETCRRCDMLHFAGVEDCKAPKPSVAYAPAPVRP